MNRIMPLYCNADNHVLRFIIRSSDHRYMVFRARWEFTRRDTSDPASKPNKLASFFKKYPGQNQAGQKACLKDAIFFLSSPKFVL